MTDTFCPMPWITQSTRNNGDLRICCQANVGEDQGLIRKTIEPRPYYYFVRTQTKYNPDPMLYIANRIAGKKTTTTEITNKTFHNVKDIIKNAWVSKTALFRATYVDDDSPEHLTTMMMFTSMASAEQYVKKTDIADSFKELDFDYAIEQIMMTHDDTEKWVAEIRNRYEAKDRILQESRLDLTYFDLWSFRNVSKVYNAKDAVLNDARNVPMLKQARLDMLEGKWPNACKRCEDEEAAGIRSRMQYENERWSADNTWNIEKAIQATADDGSINTDEVPVVFYDLRFGNLCNLKCRMCGPTDSSQWYEDQVKMYGNKYQDTQGIVELQKDNKGKYKPIVDIYGWYENSTMWPQLEENMPKIRHLYLVGGEPLMINEHYAFLQKCVDRGEAHHIVLEYNTNIPDRAWNIWKHFEKIEIGASVDGIGKVVEYIRHPAKWDILERNIRLLDNAEGNFKLWLAPTIGVVNSMHLPDMVIWVLEQNFKRFNTQAWKPPVTPHPLHHPKWLNMKILPVDVKKYITRHYMKSKPLIKDLIYAQTDKGPVLKEKLYNRTSDMLDKYATFLNQDDWSDLMPKFWELNDKLDSIRSESLQDAVPELYELIKHTRPQ